MAKNAILIATIIRVNNSVFKIFAYICAAKKKIKSVELSRIFAFNQI